MRAVLTFTLATLAFVIATVAISHSDTPTNEGSPGTQSEPEPITGQPVAALPNSGVGPRDPFSPYSPNQPTEALWTYQDHLTPAERLVVDHGRQEDYSAVNAAYAGAAVQRTEQARAEAAATQLGVSSLSGMGVVP